MEHRIVQVGSQYMLADFEGGRYYARAADDAPIVSRNPRALLATIARVDLFGSASAAEAAFREKHVDNPVWDIYEDAPAGGEFMSLWAASREFGLEPATLRNQIHNRSLTGYKIGRNWVITRSELERYRRENLGAVGRPSNR